MNKKGSITVIIILSLIILAFVFVFLSVRECSKNSDCPDNAYCGSDYECHNYPQKIVVKENNFFPAAIFLGLSMVTAAYILRRKKKEIKEIKELKKLKNKKN